MDSTYLIIDTGLVVAFLMIVAIIGGYVLYSRRLVARQQAQKRKRERPLP